MSRPILLPVKSLLGSYASYAEKPSGLCAPVSGYGLFGSQDAKGGFVDGSTEFAFEVGMTIVCPGLSFL
jgi:hypothetical protein